MLTYISDKDMTGRILGILLALQVMAEVASGSMYQGSVFLPSTNCLISTSLQTKEEPDTRKCAHLCITDNNCVGFGYTTSTKSCRLASGIMHPDTDSQDCMAGELLYESNTAPTAFTCVTDGWTYDSDQYTCTRDGCEDGWEYNSAGQTCIRMVASAVNRDTARAGCESMGANLAIFDSQAGLDVFQNLLTNNAAEWAGNGGGVWTDGYKSGSWGWTSGSTWFNWNTNEPSGNGVCLQVYRDLWRFDDQDCEASQEYLCEKERTVLTI